MSTGATSMTPIRVSPLIKFARWSFLILGLWYGTTRWNYLHRKEEAYRAHLREIKPRLEAEAAAKKRESDIKEAAELKKQGIDLNIV